MRQKFEEVDEKIDKIYKSTERTRKYFLWTMIISIVVIVLPLIALVFVAPLFLSLYGGGDVNQTLDSLGL